MAMTSSDNSVPEIAWLQGFFCAFGWFNSKTDRGYTFTFDVIPKPSSVREAIGQHFAGELKQLELTLLEDWPSACRELLTEWLFEFNSPAITPTDHAYYELKDPHRSFSLSHDYFREMLLSEVQQRLAAAVKPIAVWKASVALRRWYECRYDDIVFEENDRVLYLHFGESD